MADRTHEFISGYIAESQRRNSLVRTKEYIDWLYNLATSAENGFSDDSYLYAPENEDRYNALLLSYFFGYVEELANKQHIEPTTNSDDFYSVVYKVQILDKFFEMETLAGQGSITFIKEIEKPENDYVVLSETATGYFFDAVKERANIVSWLRDLREKTNIKGVVIGISGGKDSTIAAALCAEAFGAENVHGLLMPNGIQPDISDSVKVCECLNIPYETININPMYMEFLRNIENISDEARINIAPRIRMTTLYTYGQSHGYRVCGTGNLCERVLGYFTKWGDGGSDFNPLGNLTVPEVFAIGDTYSEIPHELIHKTPADGLSGFSDEERMGIKYEDVHHYVRDTKKLPMEVEEKIKKKILYSEHKRTEIPLYEPRKFNKVKAD